MLREPLVRIVYQRGVFDKIATRETGWALLFLSLGMAIFTIRDMVSRAFLRSRIPRLLSQLRLG